MSIYDTIKAQEAHFPIPQPSATMTVGTVNAANLDFKYAVPTYKHTVVTQPNPRLGGSTKPESETLMGGDVHAINVFDLKLRFNVTGRTGDFSVSVPGQAAVHAAAGKDFVEVDVGTANSVAFTLTCNGQLYSPDLPLKITRQIIAAGAITIPALPVTIIYAPPVDQQKKNVASWTAADVTGNTTTVSFSEQSSTTSPSPSPFQPWLELTAEMKVASTVLSKIPNAVAQAVGGALGVISGLLGSSTTTSSTGTTVLSQQTLTLTLAAQDTVVTNPNGGGPGQADVLYFLKNARICWFTNGGPMKLALVGWDAEDTLTASLLQNASGPTGLDQATRDALLKLDPFVAGGPAAALPSPRFVYVDTYDVNSTHTFNLSYTITSTDLQQSVRTETGVEDDTASFFAFANIGVTQTVRVQSILTQTSAAQTSASKTITRQVQFFANPKEYYSVEVYCDVIFGTFAFRSVGSSAAPQMLGTAVDKLGKPLAFSEVSMVNNGKTFRTVTDAQGQFSFRAATLQPGSTRVITQASRQDLHFTGAPLHIPAPKG